MTSLRDAATLALEALIAAYQGKDKQGQVTEAITALRAALAEPTWCEIHQHHKWCEHNGGKMGPSGWEAP